MSHAHTQTDTHKHTHNTPGLTHADAVTDIGSSRTISHHLHVHLPASVHPANHFLSHFYVATHVHVHSCTCVDVHSTWYQYCAVRWLHVFCDVYIFLPSPSLPPFSHKNPSPVPSVPTGSKGGVSSASLQRSRSDVDVNAAAVAKHRHVGQTRPAGHLPPGSYSSLGKSLVSQVGRLIRRCRNNNSRQN